MPSTGEKYIYYTTSDGHAARPYKIDIQRRPSGGKGRPPQRRAATLAEAVLIRDAMLAGIASPATASYPAPQIDMGNVKDRRKAKPEPVQVTRKQHKGPTDLYDVLIWTADGDLVCRKVGVTSRGHLRYADVCATFGLRITPYNKAKTYPTLKAARKAEAEMVKRIAATPAWRQIGKEAFMFDGKGTP